MNKNRNKKIFIIAAIVLVIVLIFVICISLFKSNGDNLLKNPGFEKNLSGWSKYDYFKKYQSDSEISNSSADKDNAQTGKKSAKIENKGMNDVRLYQKVKVKKNTIYEISCYIKIDGALSGEIGEDNEEVGGYAGISVYDTLVDLGSSHVKDTNNEWVKVTSYGKTGPAQDELEIAFGVGNFGALTTGTAWFDNAVMKEVSQAPQDAAVYNLYNDSGDPVHINKISDEMSKIIFLVLAAALLIYLIALLRRCYKDEKSFDELEGTDETASGEIIIKDNFKNDDEWKPGKKLITKKDTLIMVVMTAAYLALALFNLGDMKAPETKYASESVAEYVIVDLGGEHDLSRIMYSSYIPVHGDSKGNDQDSYQLFYLDTDGEYKHLAYIREKSFYKWCARDVSVRTSKIKITTVRPGYFMNEIGFLETVKDADGTEHYQRIENISIEASNGIINDINAWFDEQDTVPFKTTMMNSTYFDEIYFPRTAYENVHELSIYETTHPPLGKLIIAIGIQIFGMNPFGWRIMGTLFGAAMIPLIYLFAKKLFNKSFYAFCAAFLMMFDCMHFVQTRLATIDSYSAVFIILMYYFMYDIFITKSYEQKNFRKILIPLFFSGLFFGFGAATKWVCIYAGAGLAILFFAAKIYEYCSLLKEKRSGHVNLMKQPWYTEYLETHVFRTFAFCIIFFIIIPFAIYLLSYVPYTHAEGARGSLIDIFWSNQESMFGYHSKLTAPHGYSSEWWSWPFILRPIWYYSAPDLPSGMWGTIASFGNPLVWWVGIICLFAAMYIAFKKKDKKMLVVFVAFACQYLPWVLVTRAVFIYHYFTCVPFIILSTVYVIKHLRDIKVLNKKSIWVYLLLVAIAFAMFYPAMSGIPFSKSYIEKLRILPGWYF